MIETLHSLGEMLSSNAARYRKRTALISENKKMSYDELNEHVNKLANGLRAFGVKKETKVAILLLNSPEFVVAYFAIAKLGAVAVPLNYMLKGEEIKHILNDSETFLVITLSEFCEEIAKLRPYVKTLSHIVVIDKNIPHTIYLGDIYRKYTATEAGEYVKRDDVAAILYTSGTTGKPKGAMLTHYNLLSNALLSAEAIGATSRDNFICILPMFHSFACTACIMLPLSKGARITIIKSLKPFSNVIKTIIRKRVTVFVGAPSIYNVLKDIDIPKIFMTRPLRFLNPLRICISGAAALPVETIKKFEEKFRVPLLEGYGLTETSPVVSINPLKGVRKPGSIGVPLKNIDVIICSEDGTRLGPEEVGELLVKGPNVMKGYFKLFKDTDETIKEGWLKTGDMAKKDKDGYLYIADRKKDMVNVRGLKVYPKEVEEILYQHPCVAEAAVVGIKDEHRGEVPKAFIALKEGFNLTEKEIINFCRERIASFKVPKCVEFRKSLPKNATGKILKKDLRA